MTGCKYEIRGLTIAKRAAAMKSNFPRAQLEATQPEEPGSVQHADVHGIDVTRHECQM